MSRQLADTINRILETSLVQINTGKTKKAFENLAKAEKLSEKVKRSDYQCSILMLKGRAFLAEQRNEEALQEFQKLMEFSVPLFLDAPEETVHQYYVYNSFGFTIKALSEIGSVSKMEEYYCRNKKYFDKIIAAYDELIARVPDNQEYIQNYLKVLENIMTYRLDVNKLEGEPVLFERIVQNYGRLFKLAPRNLELFKKLQLVTEQFKNSCLLSRNFEAANRAFGQIEEIYSGILKKEPGHMLVSAHLLFLYETSADLYAKLGKIEKAEESLLRALDYLAEKQRASPGNTTYSRQQGEFYRMLGRAFYEEGNSEKAAQYAGKALEILMELAGKNPDDLHYQYEISEDFTELGELFKDTEDVENAKECSLQEIKIYENIHARDPEDEMSEANIAATLDQLGHLYADRGKTETAKQYYKKGLEAYEKLSESYPEDIGHEVGIANTLGYIGELYADSEPETAQKYYKKAFGILEDVVQTFPDVPVYKEDLIHTLGGLESLASGQAQYESAIQYRERITELSLQLASENPEKFDYKKELAFSFKHLGTLYEKAEKPELAKQQYSKSASVFRQVIQDENEKDLIKDLLTLALQKQATILIHEKNYSLAKEYLSLLRDYYEALYEKDPEKFVNWKGICEIRTLCGVLHKSMGNYDTAIQIYKSVFSILNKHPVSDPDNPDYQSMFAVLYTQLGIAYHLADEYDKSKEAFEKSISINAKLLDEEAEYFLYMADMAVALTNYSKLLTNMGMKKEAEEYAAKADEIKEKVMKKYSFDELQ